MIHRIDDQASVRSVWLGILIRERLEHFSEETCRESSLTRNIHVVTRPQRSILPALCVLSLLPNRTTIKTISHAPRTDVRFASAQAADTF